MDSDDEDSQMRQMMGFSSFGNKPKHNHKRDGAPSKSALPSRSIAEAWIVVVDEQLVLLWLCYTRFLLCLKTRTPEGCLPQNEITSFLQSIV